MAYSQKEYTYEDFYRFKALAEQGDASSQFYLALCYDEGQGITQNYHKAFYWYRKSAEQENSSAQCNLGWCYENGVGIDKDLYQAVFWYKKSAEQGNDVAQCNLGFCYENGNGVNKDYCEAIKWYDKSAKQGNTRAQSYLPNVVRKLRESAENGYGWAQCNLGYCYEFGLGMEKNIYQAVYWYKKAAEQGSDVAQCNLGICYKNGIGVDKDYGEAFYWLKKAADQGNVGAQFEVGYSYHYGLGYLEQDYSKAVYWYRKAAEQGNKIAQRNLGVCYEYGFGVIKDISYAVYWYKKSAEQGEDGAQYFLGICYKDGKGVEKDYDEAFRWFKESANQGNAYAQFQVGFSYAYSRMYNEIKEKVYNYLITHNDDKGYLLYTGSFDEFKKDLEDKNTRLALYNYLNANYNTKGNLLYDGTIDDFDYDLGFNYSQAVYWYEKAAEQGNKNACNQLAYCYAKGEGVTQNFVLAHKYIDKAIELSSDIKDKIDYYDSKGEIYAIQGDKDNALAMWNKILELNPEFAKRETTLFTNYIRQWTSQPPLLHFADNSIQFIDNNNNNAIDAEEDVKLCFIIENRGKGDAYNCQVNLNIQGTITGLNYESSSIGIIEHGESIFVEIPIKANLNTENGQVTIKISVDEPMGFGTETVELTVDTRKFVSPMLKVVDYTVTGSTGSVLEKKRPFDLQLLLQNVEQGDAESVEVTVSFPQGVFVLGGNEQENFHAISAGEAKSLEYSLIVNQNYASEEIPVEVKIRERHGKYAENKIVRLKLNQTLASNKIDVKSKEQQYKNIEIASLTSEVDKNIPVSGVKNNKTFAVIIANENYQNEANVPFALNDGNIFSQYCNKTLGIPTENIHYVTDASLNNLKREINWLNGVLKSYKGEAKGIFYYAGHGVPNESNKSAYLLPVDGFGSDLTTGYKLDDLYAPLGNVESQGVTIFLDACFSGAKREGDMMTAGRAIAIKVKKNAPVGKMVVFSAAQSDETAYQNNKEKHGMFTYYLLKKLQDSEGNASYGELEDYIVNNVLQRSIVLNGKSQTPSVTPSSTLVEDWKKWTLK